MKLTCAQMDVLITFYIDGDLSFSLKKQVEEHMKSCASCRAKYDIVKSMVLDLKTSLNLENDVNLDKNQSFNTKVTSQHYRLFKNNLSAYIDNELTNEENIKIKKFTINNLQARKDLEENYNIRKMMKESFDKIKNDSRHDFSRSVLRQLEFEDEANFGLHPIIKLIIGFIVIVFISTIIVLMSLQV